MADKDLLIIETMRRFRKGGSGSGNFGHSGRQGERGGSAGGGGGGFKEGDSVRTGSMKDGKFITEENVKVVSIDGDTAELKRDNGELLYRDIKDLRGASDWHDDPNEARDGLGADADVKPNLDRRKSIGSQMIELEREKNKFACV